MVEAGGRWLGVRLDLLTVLLDGAVAVAAILASQDAGRHIQNNYALFLKGLLFLVYIRSAHLEMILNLKKLFLCIVAEIYVATPNCCYGFLAKIYF